MDTIYHYIQSATRAQFNEQVFRSHSSLTCFKPLLNLAINKGCKRWNNKLLTWTFWVQ